jgi:hypothetical protein
MATKGYRKRTPEERARWRANQDRLERVLQKALDEMRTTREELQRRLGESRPSPGNS